MKNIKVFKDKEFFSIDNYPFIETDSNISPLPVYRVVIKKGFDSVLDVRYWFEEIIGEKTEKIKFFNLKPSELIEYIKNYEIEIPFRETYLFHDMKVKYIDFLLYDTNEIQNNIIFIGFSIFKSELHLAIRTFSLEGLLLFTEKFFKYCEKEKISLENKKNLKWIQLENCTIPTERLKINSQCKSFLEKTFDDDFCKIFFEIFKEIDEKGYINNNFLEKKLELKGYPQKIKDIKQVMNMLSTFSKININDSKKKVLYLHDILLNTEDAVYSLNPYLIQYYQLYWFEDFCTMILENINISEFKITNICSGRKFNFFSNKNNLCEIDIIFEVKYKDIYKIIVIECKKTLTESKIDETNKKVKEKILDSNKKIIDAHISIGCFCDNKINFNKIKNNKKYKEGKIHSDKSKLEDIPYYAFSISSKEDLKDKLIILIEEIFKEY